jgi:hypothetical protein
VDHVVEEIVFDQIVMNNQDLLHPIKANNHHQLNHMMINKIPIVVDNAVVVEEINVVRIVVLVKVAQMLIQMHQHLIIQMIFPLFQNSKMVKLTQKKHQ